MVMFKENLWPKKSNKNIAFLGKERKEEKPSGVLQKCIETKRSSKNVRMDFQWKCPVCSKILKHQKSISRHKKIHSDSLHECDKCQKKLTELKLLKKTYYKMYQKGQRA